jgi:flagellum-specific ATP synthase
MPACNSEDEQNIVSRARAPLAVYEDMAELIRLGAYKPGTNVEVDAACKVYPKLEAFLTQKKDERATLAEGYTELEAIMAGLGNGSKA